MAMSIKKLKPLIAFTLLINAVNPLFAQEEREAPWPRIFVDGIDTFYFYQPQVDKFENAKLESRAAVAVRNGKETFGVVWIRADADVDKENDKVTLRNITFPKYSFPTVPDNGAAFTKEIDNNLPHVATISYQRMLVNLAANSDNNAITGVEVKNEVPKILVSNKPAFLILVDGEPKTKAITGSRIKQVYNTNSMLLYDESQKKYFTQIDNKWIESIMLTSDWTLSKAAPAELESAKNTITKADTNLTTMNEVSDEVKTFIKKGGVPAFYVSTTPAELIITQGEPKYQPIKNTGLLYIENSNADIIKSTVDNSTYLLITGRWYKAPSLNGPWTFVAGDQLPDEFKRIPPESEIGSVLTSVPGTEQANETAIAAQIPQTATVSRSDATFNAAYDGEPVYEDISSTPMQYVKNSSTPVIRVTPYSYYAVENGVWFTSSSASGPWVVATSVPSEIYNIPPSSPVYYVTYVRVYDYTPTVVYVGYYPGYMGCYISPYGTVVYGTGYYYSPWIGSYYYGYPATFGYGVSMGWSYYYGWGVSFGFGYPYGGPCYPPMWGPYHHYHPHGYYGGYHGGYHGVYYGHHAPHGTGRQIPGNLPPNNYNAYNNWNKVKPGTVRPPANTIRTGKTTTIPANTGGIKPTTQPGNITGGTKPTTQPGSITGGTKPSTMPSGVDKRQKNYPNNVYSDQKGNVYRNDTKGNWQQNTGNNWHDMKRRQQTQQLNRESKARYQGDQRTNQNLNRAPQQNYNRPQTQPSRPPAPGSGRK